MSTFVYRARDAQGALITGEVEGTHPTGVKQALAIRGLLPVSVQPKGFEFSLKTLLQKKIKPKDLANLTRQFQVMFKAGTPMDRILATLVKQTHHHNLKEALSTIHKDVAGGMRLAQAFGRHPQYFSTLYTSMLEAGERGGVLDKTLKEAATVLQKEHQIHSKVKSATLYPKLVIGALLIVVCLMLVFVIPAFENFYGQHDTALPLPTQILLGLSKVFTTYWYLPLFFFFVSVVFWKRLTNSSAGKRWLSQVTFRLPVFGNFNLLVANARFGHLVAALYRAGLPLSHSLGVVADTMTNLGYADELRSLKKDLEEGGSLSQGMSQASYFTPMMQETCAVGEQTGKLDELLESTALFYDEEIDDILKNLTTLIEPLLLFLVFGLITLVALAVYLPVWNLSKVVLPG